MRLQHQAGRRAASPHSRTRTTGGCRIPGRTARWVAFWTFALCRIGQAAPVLIDFETVPSGTAIINQFASQGVTFNQPTCINVAAYTGIPDFAHSGNRAAIQCFAGEFCVAPVRMDFTTPQRTVKVWAGYIEQIFQTLTVRLLAFDSQGGIVAQASVDFPPPNRVPIRTPLEVVVETQTITRAEVWLLAGGENSNPLFMAIDDIEFDTEGPPPVCPATVVPVVTLLKPAPGTTTEINSFFLQGFVSTQTPLVEARLTIERPDGTTSSGDLLSPGIVKLNSGGFGPIRVFSLIPGLSRIQVTVANCKGSSTARGDVTYTPLPAGTKFLLKNLEVTQTIQDLNNTVPLIAGKPTIARAYLMTVNPPGGTIHDVSGTMSAFLTDGSFPGGPVTIRSLNSITVKDQGQPQILTDLSTTLNFELPPEWTPEGIVHFEITSLSINGIPTFLPCVGCSDPLVFRTPRAIFETAPPLRIVAFSVPYTTTDAFGNMATFTPAQTHFDHLSSWLRRAYPTADVQFTQSQICPIAGRPTKRGDDTPGTFDCDDVDATLSQLLTLCSGNIPPGNCGGTTSPQTHFYGMAADTRGFLQGCSKGIPSRVASGPAGVSAFPWDTDGSYADWYGAHELAHTYGRKHPGFCNNNSDDDDDYPYSDGKIGGSGIGFDFGDTTLGISRTLLSPGQFTDVMTYCDFEWMSDYTYKGILGRMRDIEGSGGGEGAGGGGQVLADGLLAQGVLNLTTGESLLRPFLRLGGMAETARPAQSAFAMELENAPGIALATYTLEVFNDPDAPPGGELIVTFDVVVPFVAGTRRIVILQNGAVLASRPASLAAPQVQLITPNGPNFVQPGRGLIRVAWQGSDPDGEPLTYTIFYSSDNGQSWEPIETALTTLQIDLPISRLRGGNQALFRILATDGVNTSHDDQDEPMTIAQKPPEVRILTPENGAQIARDQALILRGQATDLEDGVLDGNALEWTSDRHGVLGRGRLLSASGLSRGLHRVTLSARDSAGTSTTTAVEVEVLATPLVAQAAVDPVVLIGGTVALDGTASTGEGLLSFSWSLLSRPAGSSASVSSPQAPLARFVADRAGVYSLQLLVQDSAGQSGVALPVVQAVSQVPFVRAEANGDGRLDISDPVRVLGWLFSGQPEPVCLKAVDANDDGRVDLSDSIFALGFLFTGGAPPAAPFPQCGVDSTSDGLSCRLSTCP